MSDAPQGPPYGQPPHGDQPPYGQPPTGQPHGAPPPQPGQQPPGAPPYGAPQPGPPYGAQPYGSPPPAQAPPGSPPPGPPYGGQYLPHGQPPYGAQAPGFPPPPRPRRTGLFIGLGLGGVAFLTVAALLAFFVFAGGEDDSDDGSATAASAGPPIPVPGLGQVTAMVNADGSVKLSTPAKATPVVDVYADFQCPACKTFHQRHDRALKNFVRDGGGTVVIHPMVLLATSPARDNSFRAATAAYCIKNGAMWLAYADVLFARQPAETESGGYDVKDLIGYGSRVGITESAFGHCVRRQTGYQQVRQVSERLTNSGVNAVPMVRVNGKTLPTQVHDDPARLLDAIRGAAN